jgi:hypothetical protein
LPLFFFFFFRRRARSTQPINDETISKSELPGDGKQPPVLQPPVYPQPNAELEGNDHRGPISASGVSVQGCQHILSVCPYTDLAPFQCRIIAFQIPIFRNYRQ